MPITDRLAVRLAANSTDIEGYTSEIGSSRKLDEQQNQQVRLGIQFESGRFTSYTAASYIHVDQTAPGQVLSAINLNSFPYNLPPVFAPFVYGPTCFGAWHSVQSRIQSCVADGWVSRGITLRDRRKIRGFNGADSAIRRNPLLRLIHRRNEMGSILNVAIGRHGFPARQLSAKNFLFMKEPRQTVCCAIDA